MGWFLLNNKGENKMKFKKDINSMIKSIEEASTEEKAQVIMESVQELVAQENAELIAEYQAAALEVSANAENTKKYGLRQLSKEDREFYELMKNPRQLAGAFDAETDNEKLIPTTITNFVLEDLKKEYPLFNHINWAPAGLNKWFFGEMTGKAVWGTLDAKVTAQIKGQLDGIDLDVNKLSAFAFIPKALFDIGFEWVDKFLREALKVAMQDGLEEGIVAGKGKASQEPVGLKKSLVGVVDGVYKDRTPVAITNFGIAQLGTAVKTLTNQGKKKLKPLVLIVNPLDALTKVADASKVFTANGDYKTVFPYPIEVIASEYVNENEAILYTSKTYTAGVTRMGIDTSEHAQFLDDNIVYKTVAYGNGRLHKDYNAVLLDITNLEPLALNVKVTNFDENVKGV